MCVYVSYYACLSARVCLHPGSGGMCTEMYVAGLCAWAVSACARVPFCKHLHIPCAYSCMCMCLWGQPSKVDGALEMDPHMCTKTLCSLHQAA